MNGYLQRGLVNVLVAGSSTLANGCHTVAPPESAPPRAIFIPDTTPPVPRVRETMLRDPRDLTMVQLVILQGYTHRYWNANRRLPLALDSLASLDPEVARVNSVDGWGHEVRFQSTVSEYELRSAGADGTFDTSDDLVVTGISARARPCRIDYGDGRVFDFGQEPPLCPHS